MLNGNKFVLSDASFDPETLNLLSGAFEDAGEKFKHRAIGLLDPATPM